MTEPPVFIVGRVYRLGGVGRSLSQVGVKVTILCLCEDNSSRTAVECGIPLLHSAILIKLIYVEHFTHISPYSNFDTSCKTRRLAVGNVRI